jgi:hypothetical protein
MKSMSSRLAAMLLAALGVVGGIVWFTYSENQRSLLKLEGSILKVRTYQLSPDATLVFADFRVANPTGTPFVVDSVEMELDRGADAPPLAGGVMTRREIDTFFAYEKLAGARFNDPLIIQDRIPAGETLDRMAAARFDVPESEVEARAGLRLRIREIDGAAAELAEAKRP